MVPLPSASSIGVHGLIPLAAPNLTGKEAEYAAQAIARGYIGPRGPFVEKFEAAVARAADCQWAVAVITGSAAIHATAVALGFNGGKVRVYSGAYPAARNVFYQLGCELVESDPYWEGDDVGIGEDHDFAYYRNQRGAKLGFADCAPAIGETREDGWVVAECYSFAANKIVTCGQGGAVVGNGRTMENAIREVIQQGRRRDGIANWRMADINAAIGCAQMERLDELKAAKRRIWQRYADAGLPMMERGASRWMATTTRKVDIAKLAEMGIEAREECGGVSLPCGTGLTETEQEAVVRACGKF